MAGRLRERAAGVARLLAYPNGYFYVCGLKDMEEGVELALQDIARQAVLNWEDTAASLRRNGRPHLQTH